MGSKRAKFILMGLAVVSAFAVPQAAPARGGGGGGGGHFSIMSGGMMNSMRTPMMVSPGGGVPFGNVGGVVTPRFRNFPFFGDGSGFIGGDFSGISQPFVMPPPIEPQQALGPMDVQIASPAAQPIAIGTHRVFVDGTPVTTRSPIVTEYHWPSSKQPAHHNYSRMR
jgi:hypothetical protein